MLAGLVSLSGLFWLWAPVQGAAAAPPAENRKDSVTVRVVKYDGLKEAVKACHGKVLVVDVWSTT
jgi:hypothetical protein